MWAASLVPCSTTLDLSYNSIQAIGPGALPAIIAPTIDLSHNALTSAGLVGGPFTCGGSDGSYVAITVHMDDNDITDLPADLFSDCPFMGTLTLARNSITFNDTQSMPGNFQVRSCVEVGFYCALCCVIEAVFWRVFIRCNCTVCCCVLVLCCAITAM